MSVSNLCNCLLQFFEHKSPEVPAEAAAEKLKAAAEERKKADKLAKLKFEEIVCIATAVVNEILEKKRSFSKSMNLPKICNAAGILQFLIKKDAKTDKYFACTFHMALVENPAFMRRGKQDRFRWISCDEHKEEISEEQIRNWADWPKFK